MSTTQDSDVRDALVSLVNQARAAWRQCDGVGLAKALNAIADFPLASQSAPERAASPVGVAEQLVIECDKWKRWCEDAEKTVKGNLLSWAVDRWLEDVKNRPMVNIYRPGMDKAYRTLVHHLGGEPDELLGTEHKARVAAGESDAAPTEPVNPLISRLMVLRVLLAERYPEHHATVSEAINAIASTSPKGST